MIGCHTYHKPSAIHPVTCTGCTTDITRHGKEVVINFKVTVFARSGKASCEIQASSSLQAILTVSLHINSGHPDYHYDRFDDVYTITAEEI